MNPIQKIVSSRLSSLMGQYESVEAISHMATRGQLREGFLIDFFKAVIPQRLSINSGIVCDASGTTTTQLDFIVTDESFLPSMGFEGRIAVVPVESALMTAEIKTTLTTSALEQVKIQNNSIAALRFTNRIVDGGLAVNNIAVTIPNLILAFKSDVNRETLTDWLRQNTNTIGICVINEFALLRLDRDNITVVTKADTNPDFWETLVFVGKLYHGLTDQIKNRQIIPDWDKYMQG
jgi:hypothetical protein